MTIKTSFYFVIVDGDDDQLQKPHLIDAEEYELLELDASFRDDDSCSTCSSFSDYDDDFEEEDSNVDSEIDELGFESEVERHSNLKWLEKLSRGVEVEKFLQGLDENNYDEDEIDSVDLAAMRTRQSARILTRPNIGSSLYD